MADIPPPPALYREAEDTVVLTSDSLALRFFPKFGAIPLQIYQPGYPPLMHEFAGSGASVTWRTVKGNDPTEGSSDGVKENPIHTKSNPVTAKYNYIGRETVFDPINLVYEVKLFCPFFWLSAETHDDAIATSPGFENTGWWTAYKPGKFGQYLGLPTRPVIFSGEKGNRDGYFFIGSEKDDGNHWADALAEIPDGRVAFKINLSLYNAGTYAFGGFLFRATVPKDAQSKHDVYLAPGIRLNFNKFGKAEAIRAFNGQRETFWSHQLTKAQTARLNSRDGAVIEVRTHNSLPGRFWLLMDDEMIAEIHDEALLAGPHFALYANAPTGYVLFQSRAVYDVGLELTTRWTSAPIVSDMTLQLAPGVSKPRQFERIAMPAMFLNQSTFPEESRMVALVGTDYIKEVSNGSHLMRDVLGAWAGNRSGTHGLLAIPEIIEIDDAPAPGFHIYLDTNTAVSNEFTMHIDPTTDNAVTEASKVRVRTRWFSRID